MKRERERRLVTLIRSGRKKWLKTLIMQIVQEPVDRGYGNTVYSKLELFAWKHSKTLREWDVDDIISIMQTIVWHCASGPDQRNWWRPDGPASFTQCAWALLKQAIATQYVRENAKKRTGDVVELMDAVHVIGAAAYQRDDRELQGDELLQFEYLRERLGDDNRLILDLLVEGYTTKEIGALLARPHDFWDANRVRQRIREVIRPSGEALRTKLRASTCRKSEHL